MYVKEKYLRVVFALRRFGHLAKKLHAKSCQFTPAMSAEFRGQRGG
jgi:hypothetical protein